MKVKYLAPLLVSFLLVSGCNKGNNAPKEEKRIQNTVNTKMSGVFDNKKEYDLEFGFDSDLFFTPSNVFNKDIAMLSYGASVSSVKDTWIQAYYTGAGFSDVKLYGYDKEPEVESIAYTIAKMDVNNVSIVSLTVRGFDYKAEWSNNFEIGLSGNHVGFEKRSLEVYETLKTYLATLTRDYKLWITGYSRGGAISNFLAHYLHADEELNVNKENMYVYTFEAPRGLTKENAVAYDNVFNVVNRYDLIARLLPKEHELYRCGIDVDIYNEQLDTYLFEFDNNALLPEFVPVEGCFSDLAGLFDYIRKDIEIEEGEELEEDTVKTRESLVNNYQEAIRYVVKLIFTMESSTLDKIITRIGGLSDMEKLSIVFEDGLYTIVKPILDEDNVEYEDEELRANLNIVATKFVIKFISVLGIVLNGGVNDLMYVINMHFPEVNYVLLKNYQVEE